MAIVLVAAPVYAIVLVVVVVVIIVSSPVLVVIIVARAVVIVVAGIVACCICSAFIPLMHCSVIAIILILGGVDADAIVCTGLLSSLTCTCGDSPQAASF